MTTETITTKRAGLEKSLRDLQHQLAQARSHVASLEQQEQRHFGALGMLSELERENSKSQNGNAEVVAAQ